MSEKDTKKPISFKEKSRVLSHAPGDDPMRRKIFNDHDINQILKIVPDEKLIEKKDQLLELLNNITGFVASFFPICSLKTPGKTDEKLLLEEIEKSINIAAENISILLDKYGHQTYLHLSIVDSNFKRVDTRAYLEETVKQIQNLSYSIPSALNKLKWCDIFIITWNKKDSPTDQHLERLSKANKDVPVLLKIKDRYILWGKKKGEWRSTNIPTKDSSVFNYLDFNKKGQLINVGNQFKNPDKISALKGHDQLRNGKGKKRGNNSQNAIPQLVVHLAKVYLELTNRNANDNFHHGKHSKLGFHGQFYDFSHAILTTITNKLNSSFPNIDNPFSINLGARASASDLPCLSLGKHIERTLKGMQSR